MSLSAKGWNFQITFVTYFAAGGREFPGCCCWSGWLKLFLWLILSIRLCMYVCTYLGTYVRTCVNCQIMHVHQTKLRETWKAYIVFAISSCHLCLMSVHPIHLNSLHPLRVLFISPVSFHISTPAQRSPANPSLAKPYASHRVPYVLRPWTSLSSCLWS